MITITETDDASNQGGEYGGEPVMTAWNIARFVPDEIMVRLLSMAGDPDLPTDHEIASLAAKLKGPCDRNWLILFLRQNKIDQRLGQMEKERQYKEYLRGHGIK